MVNFGYIKVERRTVSNRVATSAGNSSPDSKGPPPKSCRQRPPVESFLKSSAPPDSAERKFHSQLLAQEILSRVFLSIFHCFQKRPTSPYPSHFGREFCFKARQPSLSLSRFSRYNGNDWEEGGRRRRFKEMGGKKASRNFI